MTDSTHRDSGITTSSEVLAHYAKTALMYEELRAAIDGGHESMSHADALAEISAMRAENAALQLGYDAARLEIEHLRGVTESKLLAQPVAWMVYLPSIDTQHLYYSQEDMGYVDDVTNHADAEVTPLYEMAAPKAELAPSGEYPPLPTPDSYLFQHEETGVTHYVDSQQVEWGFEKNNPRLQRIGGAFTEAQMRAYVDTDRAMRAKAASTTDSYVQPVPDKCDRIVWRGNYYHLPLTPPAQEADSVTAPASGEVAGWLPVHSNGHKFYGAPLKTEAEAKQYINQVHQSSDSVTLIARPFTWIATPPTQAASSVLEDAARYRWLAAHCRSTTEHWGGRWSIVVEGPAPKSHDSEDDFDAAIDAARKQGANHEQ